MKKFRSLELQKAYNNGGYRERYAMENGNKTTVYINGCKCFKFTYSKYISFQDANGATYNTITNTWID